MNDTEILRRAYDRENDTRDRRPPHLRSWEYFTIGASRKDITRLIDEGLVIITMKAVGKLALCHLEGCQGVGHPETEAVRAVIAKAEQEEVKP